MSSKLTTMYQGQPERGSPTTEVIRDGAFSWIKGIDVDTWPERPYELFPGKRVLARFWIGGDSKEHDYMVKGRAGADEYVDLLQERYYKVYAGGVRDVLGPNEPHPHEGTWKAYEEFQYRWIERVAGIGFNPWAWSFGVGWPGLIEGGDAITARNFIGSIGLAKEAGGGLELHEYGAPQVLSGEGWWTLRYRRLLYELQTAGLHDIPIWIGECGIDGGVIGQGGQGWKSFTTMGDYWLQLSAYDDQIMQDSEIVAASTFLTNPNNSKWASFDVAEWLLRQMAAKHDALPPEPPPGECACAELAARVAIIESVVKEMCYVGADTAEMWSEWLDRLGRMIGPRE